MKKYFIVTYGCQMNKSDSERIIKVLEDLNYKSVQEMSRADLVIINMCSVRQSAVDRVWGQTKIISNLRSQKPNLISILTGCILKKDREKLTKKFDLILDIQDLPKLPVFLKFREKKVETENYLKIQPKYQSKFSAFVPIMTGCNNFCTYCVVPFTRGREISRPAKQIINEIEKLISNNYKEIWLLGQNVNSYKDKNINFPKLLRIVDGLKGNFWVRFTSSHPKDFSDELIYAVGKLKKVTEYLNLPIQSGDDGILKKMNRPYTVKKYKDLIEKIREKIANITLSTDVIVGFPGETEEQFKHTVKIFKEIKYDMAYIARYSPRIGTAAMKFKDNIPIKEKRRRYEILSTVLKESALENNKRYIGKQINALIETQKEDFSIGKTRTYKTVKFQSNQSLIGQFVKVKITQALPWGLKGELMGW